MKFETLEFSGAASAIHCMRNPMDSWAKSDSLFTQNFRGLLSSDLFEIGAKDVDLSNRLLRAGPEHCKHLRMINVTVDITAPRFWLIELDTYRAGVEKVSCSTMHRLMSRPLTKDDFECSPESEDKIESVCRAINGRMETYRELKKLGDEEKSKEVWRGIIEMLPQSYLQKRTYMFSYAALHHICQQREGHKLKEWAEFIKWARSLPYAFLIFDVDEIDSEKEEI